MVLPDQIVVNEFESRRSVFRPGRDDAVCAISDPIDCGAIDPRINILSGMLETNPGWSSSHYENANNHSLVIRVDFGAFSFLFTGDLEEDGIERLMENYANVEEFLNVDVYQVGHHGSRNATTAELIKAMSPEIAVISTRKWDYGRPNTPFTTYAYGHPNKGIVSALVRAIKGKRPASKRVKVFDGAKRPRNYTIRDLVYSTSWDGTVKITADSNGAFTVSTEG